MSEFSQIRIEKYNPALKKVWDDFVESSKNGTFLFYRDYMDYHSDRFKDHSLLFYRKEKLYCLLPANESDGIIYSHQGLTYGGLIMNEKCTGAGILECFMLLTEKLREEGYHKLIYKPVPHIYHVLPSEEDLYALFRHNAQLTVRNISSTIDLGHLIRFAKDRREAVRRGERNGLEVKLTTDYDTFWHILEENLKINHNAIPVHSRDEIKLLAGLFPKNIELWGAYSEGEMLGGVLCYYTSATIHTQYISASVRGKENGAIDLIIDHLINRVALNADKNIKWFDFGISNEDRGRYLNESLIYQKQGFGGRGICYDMYEVEL